MHYDLLSSPALSVSWILNQQNLVLGEVGINVWWGVRNGDVCFQQNVFKCLGNKSSPCVLTETQYSLLETDINFPYT